MLPQTLLLIDDDAETRYLCFNGWKLDMVAQPRRRGRSHLWR